MKPNLLLLASLLFLSFLLFLAFSALMAPSASAINFDEMTALQKHVSFFDRNKDGVIYPWETFQGFRAIGCGIGLSTASAAFINGFLGPKTSIGIFASPLFPIYIVNIKKGKHGSDSGAYDSEGRFVSEKFEEIFQKHAHTHPNALTEAEITEMLNANKEPNDSSGSLAASTEWKILYSLCKDKDGLLQKETIRNVYDGSLFLQMEKGRKTSPKKASLRWSY